MIKAAFKLLKSVDKAKNHNSEHPLGLENRPETQQTNILLVHPQLSFDMFLSGYRRSRSKIYWESLCRGSEHSGWWHAGGERRNRHVQQSLSDLSLEYHHSHSRRPLLAIAHPHPSALGHVVNLCHHTLLSIRLFVVFVLYAFNFILIRIVQ